MRPFLCVAQMRRDDGADRALIGGAVRVAADILVNRADVETCAAADAMESVALLGIGKQAGATVIEEDHVKFLRAVGFALLPWSADQRTIRGDGLARATPGQQRPEQRKVFEA